MLACVPTRTTLTGSAFSCCACSELISITDMLFCTLCYICNSEILVSFLFIKPNKLSPQTPSIKTQYLVPVGHNEISGYLGNCADREPLATGNKPDHSDTPVKYRTALDKAHVCTAWCPFSPRAHMMCVLCGHADQLQTWATAATTPASDLPQHEVKQCENQPFCQVWVPASCHENTEKATGQS